MSIITARIPDKLDQDLEKLAFFQDRTKSNIVKRAIAKYVVEMMEDMEDIKAADEALARIASGEKTIPWEQVKRECGLLEN